jgi:hypothetical protein
MRPIQGMVVVTAMRAHLREVGAHTQVRHKVAEIGQTGGSPTAQNSANRIGPIGWFPTATNRKGKESGKNDARAINDATMEYSTPTTGLTSQMTRNGSVKSGRSGKSQSLEERKSSREKAQLSLDLATAQRKKQPQRYTFARSSNTAANRNMMKLTGHYRGNLKPCSLQRVRIHQPSTTIALYNRN